MPLNAMPLGAKVTIFVLAAIIVMTILLIGFCFSQPHRSVDRSQAAPAVAQQAPSPASHVAPR